MNQETCKDCGYMRSTLAPCKCGKYASIIASPELPTGIGCDDLLDTESMNSKVIRIEMPDGSEWDVPAELVAHSRAKYYADKDTGETSGREHSEVYQHELEYTLRDHSELLDWAANNMNWEDVQHAATMHKSGGVDYQEGWLNGDRSVVEVSNAPGERIAADKPKL